MKDKYVIIDLRNMDYMKDGNDKISLYDTEEEASNMCGIHELEDSWVCKLMYNHKEDEILSYYEMEQKKKLEQRSESIKKILDNE